MLHYWLKPLSAKITDITFDSDSLGNHIVPFTKDMNDITAFDVALFGVHTLEADAIRMELYRLSLPENKIKIIDVGNLRNLETATIVAVIKELLAGKILPVVLGAALPITYQIVRAYEDALAVVSLALVDEMIRVFPRIQNKDDKNLISHIFDIKIPKISTISVIGYQTHFTHQKDIQFCKDRYIECIRLGRARAEIESLEPIIRDADVLSFNIAAIRCADAPAQTNASPGGFFIDEACQIARYAGMSDKMTAFFIFGYEAKLDSRLQTAQTIAQICWYFLEGFYQRKRDFPVSIDNLTQYVVNYKDADFNITFWKSPASGRWWMQIPMQDVAGAAHLHLISCAYKDYEGACNGDLSERLVNAMQRFS